jgi:hypothetical protein
MLASQPTTPPTINQTRIPIYPPRVARKTHDHRMRVSSAWFRDGLSQ